MCPNSALQTNSFLMLSGSSPTKPSITRNANANIQPRNHKRRSHPKWASPFSVGQRDPQFPVPLGKLNPKIDPESHVTKKPNRMLGFAEPRNRPRNLQVRRGVSFRTETGISLPPLLMVLSRPLVCSDEGNSCGAI